MPEDFSARLLSAGRKAVKSLPAEVRRDIAAIQKVAATRRDLPAAMRKLIGLPLPVQGQPLSSITVIDAMGADSAVVQAARTSYGKGTKKITEDRGLVRYLLRHRHTTPFEMCELKLRIEMPIFVARQWIRHRTANVNEYSGRYSEMKDARYVPGELSLMPQSTTNAQGRAGSLSDSDRAGAVATIKMLGQNAQQTYEELLGKRPAKPLLSAAFPGVARELARIVLPLNTYTVMYWKLDLHNLLNFLRLRVDSHAQEEIRMFGEVMEEIVRAWVPVTFEAYVDYIKHAKNLSRMEINAIADRLTGKRIDPKAYGLSEREWKELVRFFPALETK